MKPSAPKRKQIRELFAGKIPSADLPDDISLEDIQGPISDSHRSCFEEISEQSVEWGGCIIVRGDGLQMPESHRTRGSIDSIQPKCRPTNEDREHWEEYVGFAHTHPWVGGLPFPGFSAMDFRTSLANGGSLALVCNGPELFALMRTRDCTLPPQITPDSEYERWARIYRRVFKQAMKRPTPNAVWSSLFDVNLIMCEITGYALYFGKLHQSNALLRLIYRPNCEVLKA